MNRLIWIFPALGLVLLGGTAAADDWPQWLGQDRAGVWHESGIVESFPDAGLPVVWRAEVASGYSGPAVADGKVYLTDYVITQGEVVNSASLRVPLEGMERVLCFDVEDGSLLWTHQYPCSYNLSFPKGPRTTPTIDDGRVYTLGAMGDLCCVEAQSGEPIWAKDLKKEYDTETPIWGFAGHPLVDGDKLICLVGGEGSVAVAFDKKTGDELWRALSASEPGYCPPTIVEVGNTRQLILWHADAINGLDPETGDVYWSEPLKPSYGMSIATPRISGNVLFACGIGHQATALLLDRDKPAASILWRGDSRNGVYCANSTPLIHEGTIYGVGQNGPLRGVDLKTGERLWETYAATTGTRRANYGTAFLVKHEDRCFLFNENGDLILARLTPAGYEEISRFHAIEPTDEAMRRPIVWSHPAFAAKSVFVRNDKELIRVSLAAE